jgi:LDH2 family malate/lactate/ureidoglycolate dehydrogenase
MGFRAEHTKLNRFVTDIFIHIGLSEDHAKIVADNLIKAEMRNVRSHGLVQVAHYVDLYKTGVYNTLPDVKIIREDDSTALIDADRGPGAPVGKYAMNIAIEKAKKNGIAAVSVKNATHFGMAAYYALDAAEEDLIGLAFTNTPPLVAPYGGFKKEIGTNPICAAFPSLQGRPVIFDAATSQAAYNKIFFARKEGKKIPLGWAVDGTGNVTDDPVAAIDEGALLPYGGYKGYGLAFVIELLTGILSGSTVDDEGKTIIPKLDDIGYLFIVIDISRFIDPEIFKSAVHSLSARLLSSPQSGNEPIYIPGEIEYQHYDDAVKNGIYIYDETEEELRKLGSSYGISLDECAFA